MAITAETRTDIIELVVTAYNAAPGTTLLNELVAIVDGGGTLADVAANLTTRSEWTTRYPSFQTAEEFAAEWLSNLVPEASSDALTEATSVVVGLINGGASFGSLVLEAQTFLSAASETDASFGTSAANFNNKVEVAIHHTVTLETADQSTTAISGVTSDDTTVETAKDSLGGGAGTGGATFTLTSGDDAIVGTAGDDAINAAAGTLTKGDTINGGDGTDTLNITATGTAPAQSATTLSNVEIVNLTASPNPLSIDMKGVTGVTQINNSNSANGATLTVSNVGAPVDSTLTGGQAATTISYTTAVTASTATSDASKLTLAGTNLGASYTASGIEDVTVMSTKSANTLSSLGVSSATKITVAGDQDLTILGEIGGSKLTTIDASGFAGKNLTIEAGDGAGSTSKAGVAVTLPTAATVTTTVETQGNQDTITLGAGNATVIAGGGDDTITSGAGTNTIMGGSGNDTIKLSGTKDTLRYAETGTSNADTIEGFSSSSVIAVNLGSAQTSTAAASADSDFGVVQSGATSPTIGNVDGKGTGTAIVFQTVSPTATSTSNPVAAGSNVLALNGAFTDGTAAGVVTALGTSANTAIDTVAGSKFLVVTYSVGNIAQVWAYNGDDVTVNGDIDAAELSLVATLSGVTQNSLTAANFATYLTSAATAGTISNEGQTINLTTPLNLVQSEANANGHFLTSADDTINVATGMLPTGTATATMGLTVIDPAGTGDSDTLTAQVLNANWDQGTLISNIETVNLEFLTADAAGFAVSSVLPGTDTINISGLSDVSQIHNVISGTAFGIGSSYTGTVQLDDTGAGTTIAALSLNLNGSNQTTAAKSATFDMGATGGQDVVTALTINANASSSVNLEMATDFTGITVKGSGDVTIFDSVAGVQAANITTTDLGFSGTLTLVPAATGTFDFSDATDVIGLDVLDISAAAGATVVTTPAVTGGESLTIKHSPAASATTGGSITVTQSGASTNDKLTVSLGSKSTGTGAGNDIDGSAGTESITVSSSAASTVTTTINDILVTAPSTTAQTVTLSGSGAFTVNNINADTVVATGVGKALTINSLTNTVGTTTLTVGDGGVTIAASGTNTITNVTSGKGNDTIRTGTGDDVINVGNGTNTVLSGGGADSITGGTGVDTITGGAGNDSITTGAGADIIILDQVTANNESNVTDFLTGTDNFQMSIATFDGAVTGTPFATVGVGNTLGAEFTTAANAAALTGGSVAASTDADAIIHLKDTGAIYLNTDGATAGGLILIGSVQPGSTLAATDFNLVA